MKHRSELLAFVLLVLLFTSCKDGVQQRCERECEGNITCIEMCIDD